MVVAVEPEVAVGGHAQQGEAEQQVVARVDGLREGLAHPLLGRRPRVVLVPQVQLFQRPVRVRVGDLPQALAVLDDMHPERLGLLDEAAQRLLENARVDGPANLQVFGRVVDRVLRIQLLGEPDSGLGRGQRNTVSKHDSHPPLTGNFSEKPRAVSGVGPRMPGTH